jgi:hypothetical protein
MCGFYDMMPRAALCGSSGLERRAFTIENSNSAVERRQKKTRIAGFSCISTVYVKATIHAALTSIFFMGF